jgi:esterase/lipase
MASVYAKISAAQGISQYQELIDLELLKLGGFAAADMSGRLWAPNVKLPILMWQVKDDAIIENPSDAQSTFDALASNDKELHWIEGTTKRFKDGYNWFGRQPEKVLSFLAKYMA